MSRLRSRASVADFGVLAPLVADPRVTDVFVNGPGPVWADRGAGAVATAIRVTESEARLLAVGLVAAAGRHVDEANPCGDARLADGIRVHVVLPPVSRRGTLLSLRLPAPRPPTLDDLDRAGFFGGASAQVLALVAGRVNLLVTGASGSGKTTLLGALLARADPSERIVTIEDVAELRIRHPQVVGLESRQANLEGAGGVDLARLVREALRMRPDRLVVGEVRGAEVRELLGALNTGHDGGAGTIHANSVDDLPARLEALGALAGLDARAVARQAVSAFGAVLHLERWPHRRLAQLGRLALEGERLVVR
jgi:pilus assembly protein CpaF